MLVAFVVAGTVLAAFALYNFYKQDPQKKQPLPELKKTDSSFQVSNVKPCSAQSALTKYFISAKEYDHIVPLGSVSPPNHSIPNERIYFILKKIAGGSSLPARIKSPGDITLNMIRSNTFMKDGKTVYSDYSMDITPCEGKSLYFGHFSALDNSIQDLVGTKGGWDKCFDQPLREGSFFHRCNKVMNYALGTDDNLGTAGGKDAPISVFALGSYDLNTKPLPYVNPARYRDDQLHIICPLDLFVPAVKSTYEAKLGSNKKQRTVQPLCGKTMQDSAASLQGNWFYGTDFRPDVPENWPKGLSFIHDNVDPSTGVIVAGGFVSDALTMNIAPKHAGTLNRDFNEVTADGKIYCFEGAAHKTPARNDAALVLENFDEEAGNGEAAHFLTQLTDENTLKIEFQKGDCGKDFNFREPKTYVR